MKKILFILLLLLINTLYATVKLGVSQEAKKNVPTIDREIELKREIERLDEIKKDVESKIEKNMQLLSKIEGVLKELQNIKNERIDSIVKIYESMPANEAAQKLSNVDEELAVKILLKMNNKKAGKILANMETKKAVSLTEKLGLSVKNFPIK